MLFSHGSYTFLPSTVVPSPLIPMYLTPATLMPLLNTSLGFFIKATIPDGSVGCRKPLLVPQTLASEMLMMAAFDTLPEPTRLIYEVSQLVVAAGSHTVALRFVNIGYQEVSNILLYTFLVYFIIVSFLLCQDMIPVLY
jgi:hypothetical protein